MISTSPETGIAVSPADSIAHLTRRVARGSAFVFVGNILGRIASFAIHILLSRVLGPAGYGLYALGRSVLRFVVEIAAMGLQSGIVRFGAPQYAQGRHSELKGTLLASFLIAAAVSTGIGLVLFFSAPGLSVHLFNDPALTSVLRIFSLAIPFHLLILLTSRAARAFHKMHYDVGIQQVAQPFFNILFVSVAFLLGYRLGGAVAAFLASSVVSAGLGLYFVARLFPVLYSRSRAEYQVRRLMKYSLTVLGASIATFLLSETDRLMLGMLGTSTDVGLYHAAAVTASLIYFTTTAVNSSFTPMIADLYHTQRREQLEVLFKTATRWSFTLSLMLCLLLVVFAGPILNIFGPRFTASIPVLTILAIGFFIDTAVGSAGLMLQMSDHHLIATVNNIVMAVLNIVLNIWLIKLYGILGAAVATGLAISLVNLAKLVQVRLLLGIHPYSLAFWKPITAAAVSALAGVLLLHVSDASWMWIVGLLVAGIVYPAMLVGLGFEKEDEVVIAAIRRKVPFLRIKP